MKLYLLVCEKEMDSDNPLFDLAFVKPFTSVEKAKKYANDWNEFKPGYQTEMIWVESKDATSWRSEEGSFVFTISETSADPDFNQ